MSVDAFVHLHTASGYSLRYGASTPSALVQQAALHGQQALALTDRDGLYGAVKFLNAAGQAGVAPILGVDLAIEPSGYLPAPNGPAHTGGRVVQPSSGVSTRRSPARGGAWIHANHPRVVLLARGAQGWASLCRLVTAAQLSGERGKPITNFAQIAVNCAGLVLLLGPESEVGRALRMRRPDVAAQIANQWRELFSVGPTPASTRLVVEVVSHMVPENAAQSTGRSSRSADWVGNFSIAAAARMYGWAQAAGFPSIIANAVRHARPEQAQVVDVLDSIRRLVPLSGRHLDRGNAEGYLKSGAAMQQVAQEILGAAGVSDTGRRSVSWLGQTAELGHSCVLDPASDVGLGSIRVPELGVVAPDAPSHDDLTTEALAADQVLSARCTTALDTKGYRRKKLRQAQDRLADELKTISQLQFGGYFLTVAEVVDLIRSHGVRVAARGSGAGSLVNHLLGISGVDPIEHGLLMERFLSPLRQALPDIDVDVESDRRTEMYERILDRFGGERCTCVSMMDTYRVRHAIRDVGAALVMPPSEIDTFAKAFPHIRARDARAALADLPELKSSGLGRLASEGKLDTFLNLVESLDGLPRHVALHPCGVLLSDTTLLDRTPVEASWMGFPMSQFDKDDVEEMGFLKLDVLGIRMQSAMAHATSEIARVSPEVGTVDIDAIALDDPDTFELIQSAKTLGCFQIESPGQRELVGKFSPQTFDDLVIDISLFRPGPVKSDMITPFLRARHGWAEPEYLLPELQPILEETSGVVVFHEQVIRIVSRLTGCSLARADEIRRTMGSPEGQQEVRAWFYPTAQRCGFSLAQVEQVWDVLKAFASFGFCKAHAAAFALPTYQSAWLKTHYCAAFFAGILTHDPGMYPKRLILDDARNSGVKVLGLDVNKSDRVYRVEQQADAGQAIRVPISAVKGISTAEEVAIVASQPYQSLADFWNRAGVSRPTCERLVLAGGFDALHQIPGHAQPGQATRRDLLLQVGDLDRYTRTLNRGRGKRSASQKTLVTAIANNTGGPDTRGLDAMSAARSQSQAPASVCDPEELPVQLALELSDAPRDVVMSGLPEMTPAEKVRAEVDILGMDVSAHIVSFYDTMLQELGVVRAKDLLSCRTQSEILVAGVKVATQTPPIRGGKRVVFVTVDDSTGPVDATFFEAAQGPYASTLFQSWLLLIRGKLRRTGKRGVSLRATGCWDLGKIREVWGAGGAQSVSEMLAIEPDPETARESGQWSPTDPNQTRGGGMGQRRRVLLHASGFKMSPYADTKPAGQNPKAGRPAASKGSNPPSKLWHSSPGSSGW
ncbi:MAG: DNA polymerase III subunit alpha [Actinomycetia bacterium]|nr:DNA polymerase III subunit alpha [Actinomycetes bacterium]